MENSALIEDYFTSNPGPDQIRSFEKRIESDPAFAEEVAFYLSVHTVAREVYVSEKKLQFRALYQKNQNTTPVLNIKTSRTPVRKLVYYIAAAAVVAGIVFGVYTINRPVSPSILASEYENNRLLTLSVTMSGHSDSIQTGLTLYNEKKLNEALLHFEKILQSDSSDLTSKKYAGLASLRLKEYDKALDYFKQLETHTELYSNPAIFYQALTLMDRNQSGDAAKAKQLLQQIVQNDLDEKETAQEWLRKM